MTARGCRRTWVAPALWLVSAGAVTWSATGAVVGALAREDAGERLLAAVRAHDYGTARACLESGAAPSARALSAAVAAGDEAMAALLLDAGADPNGRYGGDGTPGAFSLLTAAAYHSENGIVRQLLARGARPNDAPDGRTSHALREAAKAGNYPGVVLLLSAGATRHTPRDPYEPTATPEERRRIDAVLGR